MDSPPRPAASALKAFREQIGQQQAEVEDRKQDIEPPTGWVADRAGSDDSDNRAADPWQVLQRSGPGDRADIESTASTMTYDERGVGQQCPGEQAS